MEKKKKLAKARATMFQTTREFPKAKAKAKAKMMQVAAMVVVLVMMELMELMVPMAKTTTTNMDLTTTSTGVLFVHSWLESGQPWKSHFSWPGRCCWARAGWRLRQSSCAWRICRCL
jgi:rhamnogalacturonyl hydrolase YesR